MARPVDHRTAVNRALAQARRAARSIFQGQAVSITADAVAYQVGRRSAEIIAQTYAFHAAQMFASSLETTLKNIPDEVAETTLKALDAIDKATLQANQAQRADNRDVTAVMQRLAENVNQEILEQYIEDFGGHSYRQGDPQRRSGEMEAFLEQRLLAQAAGMTMTVSTAPAVGNPNVPHLFRLNYGTRSLNGPEKAGERPPTFSVSIIPGGDRVSTTLDGPRRPGFYYPGRAFTYRLAIGPASLGRPGAVQLYRSGDAMSGRRIGGGSYSQGVKPSQGIAPSFFIEYGIRNGLQTMPHEFQKVIRRWERRVSRIKV